MDKDTYYLNIASEVAKKSKCLSKHYGAIIVNRDEIIATGYNGPPRGEEHCKTCHKCGSDKNFDEYLTCRSVHAEMNAIISAARRDMIGATMYIAGWTLGPSGRWLEMQDPQPCNICLRLIKNAGIKKVITRKGVIYENQNA